MQVRMEDCLAGCDVSFKTADDNNDNNYNNNNNYYYYYYC